MDIQNEVKAVEAEVVKAAEVVETKVVDAAEKIKADVLAQKANFTAQYEAVKKEMQKLQQDFEQKKILAVKLEGAIESVEMLLKNLVSK